MSTGRQTHMNFFGALLSFPLVFAIVLIPGVLLGRCIKSWQLSVIFAEALTVIAILAIWGSLDGVLLHGHMLLFPPFLLSLLIGHFGRSSAI
jgi:hypothetical protein